jgi:hypothetical protein
MIMPLTVNSPETTSLSIHQIQIKVMGAQNRDLSILMPLTGQKQATVHLALIKPHRNRP